MPGLPLLEVPIFTGLSAQAKDLLRRRSISRTYAPGSVILQAGEPGQYLYAISSGAVAVAPAADSKAYDSILGPGEVFGEMSLLSGKAVSAQITAQRHTELFEIDAEVFRWLFSEDAFFRSAIADLLAARLRLRTAPPEHLPVCAFIVGPSRVHDYADLLAYALSQYGRVMHLRPHRSAFPSADALMLAIDAWRAAAQDRDICVVAVTTNLLTTIGEALRPTDVVVFMRDDAQPGPNVDQWNGTHCAGVRIGSSAECNGPAQEPWTYCLRDSECARAREQSNPTPQSAPTLDSIARWITRRTVGIALGAGGARGFAHIGVLQTLDAARIPLDCLSGTSMGGLGALLYGIEQAGRGAAGLEARALWSVKELKKLGPLSQSAWIRGRRLRTMIEQSCQGIQFSDLHVSAQVVATDLIQGRRVVLDRGPISSAIIATSAIPGLLPPLKIAGECLVDGGLFSVVPVDLLERGRCGLKIAVNVQPPPNTLGGVDAGPGLDEAFSGVFGLTRVLMRAWDLIGVSHGEAECRAADFVIKPHTAALSALDFESIHRFIEAGREAMEEQLPALRLALQKLVQPISGGTRENLHPVFI